MTFSPKRVQALTKNEFKQKWRIFLIVILIAFLIVSFYYFNNGFSAGSLFGNSSIPNFNNVTFSSNNRASSFKFHLNWLPDLILFTSCILTSLSFSEYEQKASATFNLTTPATQLEKWSAKAILFIIIFPLVLILLYQVFIWFSTIWEIQGSSSQVKVNILDPYFHSYYRDTILMQCLFFAGAIIYKKYSILKILLLGVGLYMIYNFTSIVSLVIINDNITLFGNGSILDIFSLETTISNSNLRMVEIGKDQFMGIPYIMFMYLFASVCIVFSFLKFKEIEA